MVMTRASSAAVFALLLAGSATAQQPADPMQDMQQRMQAMESMMQQMHHMMMSMHGTGDAQTGQCTMMQGSQETPETADGMPAGAAAPGMQAMPQMQGMMQGIPGMQGMSGMQGAGAGAPQNCPTCAMDSGIGALLSAPTTDLGLTDDQVTRLEDVLARAREEALGALTPEQRSRVQAGMPGPTGPMCGAAHTHPEHTN
jgi:hypothetical protein